MEWDEQRHDSGKTLKTQLQLHGGSMVKTLKPQTRYWVDVGGLRATRLKKEGDAVGEGNGGGGGVTSWGAAELAQIFVYIADDALSLLLLLSRCQS